MIYARRGELDKAAEIFERGLKANPTDADLHTELLNVLTRQGQHERAAAQLREAAELIKLAPP